MIKRKIIFCLLALGLCFVTLAQKNAFVLIDVSGNPNRLTSSQRVSVQMRHEAEELVKGLVLGNYDASRFNANWRLSGNTDPIIQDIVNGRGQGLLQHGGYLLMMPYGSQDTYKNFKINKINAFPADFNNYWRTPTSYADQNTFGEIAKAKAADIAIDANLSNYYLIMISGLGEDTDSFTDFYSPQEMEYLDNYKSAVIQNSLAIFRYRDTSRDFKVEISYMDLNKMRGTAANTAGTTQIITSNNVDKKNLEIVTPRGDRKSPFELKNERLLVSWTCLGCSDSTEYVVRVTNLEDKKNAQVKKVNGRFNQSFSLEGDGLYQVSVSGGAGLSDREFFELDTGGGGFGIFLLLIVLAGLGYLAYRQFFNGKSTPSSGLVGDDEEFFSQNTKPENNSQSSGTEPPGGGNASDYF